MVFGSIPKIQEQKQKPEPITSQATRTLKGAGTPLRGARALHVIFYLVNRTGRVASENKKNGVR